MLPIMVTEVFIWGLMWSRGILMSKNDLNHLSFIQRETEIGETACESLVTFFLSMVREVSWGVPNKLSSLAICGEYSSRN